MELKELRELYFNHCRTYFGDTFSEGLYTLSFLSQLNSIAIQFQPTIEYNGTISPFSICTLSISNSGSGKDCSLDFLNPIVLDAVEKINKVYKYRYGILYDALKEKSDDNSGDPLAFTAASATEKTKELNKEKVAKIFDYFSTELCVSTSAGTYEALMSYFINYGHLAIGSIAVTSSELCDCLQSDMSFRRLIESICLMYNNLTPSSMKITLSRGSDDIKMAQSSLRLHTANDAFMRSPKLFDSFLTFLRSSLARRTFIFFQTEEEANRCRLAKIEHKRKVLKEKKEKIDDDEPFKLEIMTEEMEMLKSIICDSVVEQYCQIFIKKTKLKKDYYFERLNLKFSLSKEADLLMAKYSLKCSEDAEKFLTVGTTAAIKFADEIESKVHKSLRIAALGAFFKPENKGIIDSEDLKFGIEVSDASSKYYQMLAKPNIISENVSKVLENSKEKFTISDLEEREAIPRNMSKPQLQIVFDRTKELMFQNNKIFRSTMNDNSTIPTVWSEQLESTVGELANITYSTEEAYNDTSMKAITVPFFDILKIPNIQKISSGGFFNGTRSLSNIRSYGNTLIIDVDDGDKLSIRQCMDRLRGITAFLHPSKNNNKPKEVKYKDKNGNVKTYNKICERYRIVILCKQHFLYGVNKKDSEEEFKSIYKAICEHFEIPYDKSCAEPSRFFYVPEEAKQENVIRNGRLSEPGKGTLLDLRYFIKNLKMRSDVISASKQFDSSDYWSSVSIKNILEKAISNSIITENRNNSLLIMSLSLKDYGLSFDKIKSYVIDVNSKMPNGELEDNELSNTVLSTLKKRMQNENIFPDGKNKGKEKKAEVINNIEEDDKTEFNELDNTSLVDLGIEI